MATKYKVIDILVSIDELQARWRARCVLKRKWCFWVVDLSILLLFFTLECSVITIFKAPTRFEVFNILSLICQFAFSLFEPLSFRLVFSRVCISCQYFALSLNVCWSELARDALHRSGLYSVVKGFFSPVNDGYKKKVGKSF